MTLVTHARRAAIAAILAAFAASAQTPKHRPITFKDMISMHRVSDPQISLTENGSRIHWQPRTWMRTAIQPTSGLSRPREELPHS